MNREEIREELGDLVVDTAIALAAEINDRGLEGQVKWLEAQGHDMSKYRPKKKYNHAFTIAFEMESDNPGDKVTAEELTIGLRKRLHSLDVNTDEIVEACGMPYDSHKNK